MAQLPERSLQDLNRSVQLLEEFPSKPDDLFIGKKIGTGSKGVVVHKGKYQGKDVAVKIIPDLLFDVDNEDELEKEAKKVHKFLKEVELLKQIGHKHIVKYLDAFYDRDRQEPMLVMELMSKTLKAYLKEHKKTLILSKQVNICLQIAEGLQFLHHQQPPLAHRDLTDTNVLVSEDGTFKIGDLGQAKLKPDLNRCYFSTATPGSLAYMPPEVHGASPHYTESIDIFSLGVLMVEVATQSPPTVGTMQGIGITSEFERRETDLDLMGAQHPLKPITVQCLEDNCKHRPSIDEVVAQLTVAALVERCNQEQASDEENADNGSMYEPPTHVASRRDLIDGINLYLQAARASTAHQDSGKQLLTDAANYLKKAMDNFAAARTVGKVLGIAGGVLGFAGGGLLLGAVTAPAGVPVHVVGVALGVAGCVTTVGALIRAVRVMKNSLALEKANQWTEEYKELSETLLKRLKEFHEVLSSVSQNYNESEETCLNTALKGIIGKRGAQITLESFQSAHEQATPVFVQWKAVLQTGAQTLAKDVLAAATEVGASTTRGANITPVTVEVDAETTGAVTVEVDAETTGAVTVEVDAETTGAGTVEVDAETTGAVTVEVNAETTGAVTVEVDAETTGAGTVEVNAETTSAVTVEVDAETTGAGTVEVDAETTGAVTVEVDAETTGAGTVEVGAETTGAVTVAVGTETTGAVTVEVDAETTGAVTVEVGAETTGTVTVEVDAETTGAVTVEVDAETTGAVTVEVDAETTGVVTVEVGAETTGADTVEVGAETTGAVTVEVDAETTGVVTVEVDAETTGADTVEVGAETTGAVTVEVGAETTGADMVEVGAETTGAVTVDVDAETTGADTVEVGAETTGAVTVDVDAETTGAVTLEGGAGTTGAITRGVASGEDASAEVGTTVGRVVTVAGGAVVGLSAVFIVIDLAFLGKTSRAGVLNKITGCTKLAIALREIVKDIKKQTEKLQSLANLRQ